MPISVYRRENAKAKSAEGDTRHDRATYNRVIGITECAWLEHAVGVLVVGRNETFVAIDGHRPVSMHENDKALSALSQVNTCTWNWCSERFQITPSPLPALTPAAPALSTWPCAKRPNILRAGNCHFRISMQPR